MSRWNSNPFVRGSWSYQTVSSAASGVGPADLAAPEMDGRLLFAGEATHDSHFSTTHGAVESGWREADRIIKSLKK
jgi:N1-acetylpolyamine oxidase